MASKHMKKIKAFIVSLTALLLPVVVLAQASIIPNKIPSLPGDTGSTFGFQLRWMINVFLAVVGLIAVAFLIYGGFRYMTSAGNEETAEEAKRIIQNAIIGLVVIILSYIIIAVIANALLTGSVG